MIWTAATFVIAYAAKIALVVLGVTALLLIVARWYAGMRLADLIEKYEDKMHDQ